MDDLDRPCIHISLLAGADPGLYRWVEVGAEEEGVPARRISGEAADLASLAYLAAQSSRLNVGVGVSADAVALHEQHMPAHKPVLIFRFDDGAGTLDKTLLCRMMGANAARMVVRRPLCVDAAPSGRPVQPAARPALRPAQEAARYVAPGKPPAELDLEPAQLAEIVAAVVRQLVERGL